MCQVHCGENSKCLSVLGTANRSRFDGCSVVATSIRWFLSDGPCTLPSVALKGLHLFDDEEVRQTFSDSMCIIDPSDLVWQQAQLSLSRGGLGLRSASLHSSAAFMSSFSMSSFATNTSHHLLQSLDHFNACVSLAEVISIDELLNSPTTQKMLSTKLEKKLFQLLFDASSIPNRACLMSASSNLAASWLSVIPSPGLNVHNHLY